jgi:hypothetical protein
MLIACRTGWPDTALVPAIWALEVANALRLGERVQRLAGALRFVGMICAPPIIR